MDQTPNPTDAGAPEQMVYVIYDARAKYDVDEASVLYSGYSLADAQAALKRLGPDCVLYSYRLVGRTATDGKRLA